MQADPETLKQLEIHTTLDSFGQPQLTINLQVDPVFGIADCRAVFENGQWRLHHTSHAKFGNRTPAIHPSLVNSAFKNTGRNLNVLPTWTDHLPDTAHVRYFKYEVDWARGPLGPLDTWPHTLQTMIHVLLADSTAAVIYWGPQKCAIYNEKMIDIATDRLRKRSDLMGMPFASIWPELKSDFEPMFTMIAATGVALDTLDINLYPEREYGLEETTWSGTFIPLTGDSGSVEGFYNRTSETTREMLRDRRTNTLYAISAVQSANESSVWDHVFEALRSNERDVPMAFAYSACEDPTTTNCTLTLERSIGLPDTHAHPLVPKSVDLYNGQSGYLPMYRRAKVADHPIILHSLDGSLSDELLKGFKWKGFGDKSRSIAVIPLSVAGRFLGIIVMGLNSRRPYDADYEGFLNSLTRQTSAVVANAIDKAEARQRTRHLAKQLEESERRIRDMAEHAPFGMLQIAINGKITWANPRFYQITGHSNKEEDQYELSFVDVVAEVDQMKSASLWLVLVNDKKEISVDLRLKRKWTPPKSHDQDEPTEEHVLVLAMAYPILDEKGDVVSVAGIVTDISQYRWAEDVQKRIAIAAKEAKRLQENFIDIVSHEMRNPLSAITQLSDAISMSMEDLEESKQDLAAATEILRSNVESARTILLCAAHQKRVIDDVLTMSKLDSMMLAISPVAVQPYKIVERVLKMFESEFQTNEIEVENVIDETYTTHMIDWVFIDPSRLTQIFINLITNAVKFTRLEAVRKIKIRVGATVNRPPVIPNVTWFPTKRAKHDITLGPEWGNGEPIYLFFDVVDTGKGLEQEEMMKLFNRFQQATAKTHIKYGGSGLGLFISRELTETQGGDIGVASRPGHGSTFAFYIKGRRTEAPTVDQSFHAAMDPPLTRKPGANKPPLIERSSQMMDIDPPEGQPKALKYCVLLVEDNIVNAKVLSRQLERSGCTVMLANHGLEAIDLVSQTRSWRHGTKNNSRSGNIAEEIIRGSFPVARIDFDVVLMDVEMPIMDGLTCTRRIRELENEGTILRHLDIIAITANARPEQVQSALDAGVDDVLPKPFRVGDLLLKIDEVRNR